MTDTDFIKETVIAVGLDQSPDCNPPAFIAYLSGLYERGAQRKTLIDLIRITSLTDNECDPDSPEGDAFNLMARLLDLARAEIAATAATRDAITKAQGGASC